MKTRRMFTVIALCAVSAVSTVCGQTTELVSSSSAGEHGDNFCDRPAISWDGRYVAFHSSASNLVPYDLNNASDIFVKDRETGETTRVSVSSSGEEAWFDSFKPAISADGRYVAFKSLAPNLVDDDTNNCFDVFVHDRETGKTRRVSVSTTGEEANDESGWPTMSANGEYIAFRSSAGNLVPGISGGVFVHARSTGETFCVSMTAEGTSGGGRYPSMSADGYSVAFESNAEIYDPGDPTDDWDIYVKNWWTGEVVWASVGEPTGSDSDSWEAAISADGRSVAFISEAENLVPDDTNWTWDTFVFSLNTGEVTRVSVSSEGEQADARSTSCGISGDGRYVAFACDAENLIEEPFAYSRQIYVHDRVRHRTTYASISYEGATGYGDSFAPVVSFAGRYVAFSSDAANFIPDDENDERDIFLRDRAVPGDMNGDFWVNVVDLLELLGSWGPCPEPPDECPADFDGDGDVNAADLLILLGNWS